MNDLESKPVSTETATTDNEDLPPESSDDVEATTKDDGIKEGSKCCDWWQFQGVPKAKGFSYVRHATNKGICF
jgi:hypothetical protein